MLLLTGLPIPVSVRLMWSWLSHRDVCNLDMAMCSATNRIYLKYVYKHSVLRYETKEPASIVVELFQSMVLREIKVSMLSLSVPLPAEDVRQSMISLIINSATKLLAAQIKSNNLLFYSFVNALTCTCPCLRLLALGNATLTRVCLLC